MTILGSDIVFPPPASYAEEELRFLSVCGRFCRLLGGGDFLDESAALVSSYVKGVLVGTPTLRG